MFNTNAALAIVASLAVTASAQFDYFHIEPLTAADTRVPSESHIVRFTVADPSAATEFGGSKPSDFNISWTGCDPPTCWAAADDYYARISPGTYKGANDFKLDVQKYFIYQNSALDNVTIPITEGKAGYACSRGGQSTICTFQGVQGLNASYVQTYGPVAHSPSPVC